MYQSTRKPQGTILADGQCVADTRQCVHCGRHWFWEHGSGRKRGFCLNCMGITCGNDSCHVCVPLQKKLELYEAGKLKVLR